MEEWEGKPDRERDAVPTAVPDRAEGAAGAPDPDASTDRFALRRAPAVVLHETGLRHPKPSWISASTLSESFTAYADLTHVTAGRRTLRICSLRESLTLRRSQFEQPDRAGDLVHAIKQRVGALPDGADRLEQMRLLDERLLTSGRPMVSRSLVVVCVAAFCLQLLSPTFEWAGMFNSDLVRLGELWRLLTANILHGGVVHLLVNCVGILVLGALVEGILGRRGVVFVMGISALGAMGGSYLAEYVRAIGASGIVAGLVGSLLYIEWVRPEIVPAPWRLPRGLLVAAVIADTVGLAFVPGIAHMAHATGMLAGVAATALALPGDSKQRRSSGFVLVADGLLAGAAAASLFILLWGTWAPGETAARVRAERLLRLEGVGPELLNNEAWGLAIVPEQDPGILQVARRLAEAAVERTGRENPNLLDTLAEVYFQQGDRERAISTIDEAIALAPDEPYFEEQRRRFAGERAADDRPDPPPEPEMLPHMPHPPGGPGSPHEREEPSGIRI